MTLALAHSRGWLDYEERVSDFRPEFARAQRWVFGHGGTRPAVLPFRKL